MEQIRKVLKTALNVISPGVLPEFMIVGAQKAGTTSLHYYLSQHPDLLGSSPKEVNFFSNDGNYAKGLNWYRKSFINIKNPFRKLKSFEATPNYLYRKNVAKRLFDFNPKLKIIIVLRDPVERGFSSWNMYKYFNDRRSGIPTQFFSEYISGIGNNIFEELYNGLNFPSFHEVVEAEFSKIYTNSQFEEPSFLRRGIYLPQIKRYFELFDKDQILILGFKDFIGNNKFSTLDLITDFIGVDRYDWGNINYDKTNSIKYTEKIEGKIKNRLELFYEPYNEDLFNYLGYKVNW